MSAIDRTASDLYHCLLLAFQREPKIHMRQDITITHHDTMRRLVHGKAAIAHQGEAMTITRYYLFTLKYVTDTVTRFELPDSDHIRYYDRIGLFNIVKDPTGLNPNTIRPDTQVITPELYDPDHGVTVHIPGFKPEGFNKLHHAEPERLARIHNHLTGVDGQVDKTIDAIIDKVHDFLTDTLKEKTND